MKNKILLIITILISLFTITACDKKEEKDAKKFSEEYSVREDNPFKYTTSDNLLDMINSKDTLLLFVGNKDNEVSKDIVNTLIDAALENDLTIIYYIDNSNKDESYNKLIDYLNRDDETYILEIQEGNLTNYIDGNYKDIINLAVKEIQETLATCNTAC